MNQKYFIGGTPASLLVLPLAALLVQSGVLLPLDATAHSGHNARTETHLDAAPGALDLGHAAVDAPQPGTVPHRGHRHLQRHDDMAARAVAEPLSSSQRCIIVRKVPAPVDPEEATLHCARNSPPPAAATSRCHYYFPNSPKTADRGHPLRAGTLCT